MKIRLKIVIGISCINILMLIMGIINYRNMSSVGNTLTEITGSNLPKLNISESIIGSVNETSICLRDMVMTNNPAIVTKNEHKQAELFTQCEEALSRLEQYDLDAKEQAYLSIIKKKMTDYSSAKKIVLGNLNVGNKIGATNVLLGDFNKVQVEYQQSLNELINYENSIVKANADEANSSAASSERMIFLLVVIGILLAVIITFILSKSFRMPIQELIEKTKNVAHGNLDVQFDTVRKDEFGDLNIAMDTMCSKFNQILDEANKANEAAAKGLLNTRINVDAFEGAYKKLMIGFNNNLDALIEPLRIIDDYIIKLGQGDVSETISQEFNGNFNDVRNSLNNLIRIFSLLRKDVEAILVSVQEGYINETRIDESKYVGIFHSIVHGFNLSLDIVAGPLDEISVVLKELSNGNFNERMANNYKGNLQIVKNNLNSTLDSLPLQEINSVMTAMEVGDITKKMERDYKGDCLKIKNSVNTTVNSLNSVLKSISQTVHNVNRGAMQVADAATTLSQGATEQAASLEEITSSMTEIGAQTRQNAENSNRANVLSSEARNAADLGNVEMKNLSLAMKEISNSSHNISNVIKVIDEIAFQTNLLSLNAAVEAARAGKYGKGFAVVAEEVRNLASRSAKAAKETAEMIEDSIKTTERGFALVSRTADALQNIQTGSVKVADIISEITSSSNEQAQAIAQINEALMQIDKVTQSNTASAEESASAASQLSDNAGNLNNMIEQFKLNA